MKAFTWRIIFCVVPAIVSIPIVYHAYRQYMNGEGGFKLGVDLAGGTDLIYAIDLEKFPNGELPAGYSPQ